MENAVNEKPEWVRYFSAEIFDDLVRSYRFMLSIAGAPILLLSLGDVIFSDGAISSHVKFASLCLFFSMAAAAIAIEIVSTAKRAYLMFEKSGDIGVLSDVRLFPNSRLVRSLPLFSGLGLFAGYSQLVIEVVVA